MGYFLIRADRPGEKQAVTRCDTHQELLETATAYILNLLGDGRVTRLVIERVPGADDHRG